MHPGGVRSSSPPYKSGFLKRQDSLLFPVSTFRLRHLESKVIEDVGKTPDIICELKSHVESFKRKLEVVNPLFL